jgi:hypothetical protein
VPELTLEVGGSFFGDRDFGCGELHVRSFAADIIGFARPPDRVRLETPPAKNIRSRPAEIVQSKGLPANA